MKVKLQLAIKLLFVVLLFSSFVLISSDACKTFYPMEKGKKFELTYYSDNGKVQGRTEYEVLDKQETANGLVSNIHMKSYDKKDKPTIESDFEVRCENGIFEIDIRGLLSSAQVDQMSAMEGMDVSVSTVDLELPSALSVGDKLKDGSLEMKLKASEGGMALVSFNTLITNRKVEGKESITTPAGTFDCFLITSEVQSKSGFVKMNFESKEWIAENVGLVRSESYRKGKLEGYTELTKF